MISLIIYIAVQSIPSAKLIFFLNLYPVFGQSYLTFIIICKHNVITRVITYTHNPRKTTIHKRYFKNTQLQLHLTTIHSLLKNNIIYRIRLRSGSCYRSEMIVIWIVILVCNNFISYSSIVIVLVYVRVRIGIIVFNNQPLWFLLKRFLYFFSSDNRNLICVHHSSDLMARWSWWEYIFWYFVQLLPLRSRSIGLTSVNVFTRMRRHLVLIIYTYI